VEQFPVGIRDTAGGNLYLYGIVFLKRQLRGHACDRTAFALDSTATDFSAMQVIISAYRMVQSRLGRRCPCVFP
jgi:hypothetical protein